MTTPAWGDVLALTSSDGWRSLPNSNTPYYITARDGTYLHRKTVLGRGIVRTYKTPKKLAAVGFSNGQFIWDATTIPANIYAQAVDFFRRVWRTHKTEAEVLITKSIATNEYRLFVPTQRVSHGGVYSIYNPTHIANGWLVVGTFHSHCNFSPYHSSTDESDARDMDGIHGTIGYVDRDTPEMALMVALNGTMFHFDDFAGVVDTTDLAAATAPAWWDRYLVFGTVTDADRARLAPYADDDTWDRFMGRYHKPQPDKPKYTESYDWRGYKPSLPTNVIPWRGGSENRWTYSPLLNESKTFNARKSNQQITGDYWEDRLGQQFVDELFATELFSADELDDAIDDWPDSGTPTYWHQRVLDKLLVAANYLRAHDYSITVNLPTPTGALTQTTMDDYLIGGPA